MDINVYRNYLAIVESRSFTAAAELVHVAQPALSKQIKVLENYYNTKLIITSRGSHQFFITEAGKALYDKAKYICSLEDYAKTDIETIQGGTNGTLRISIANSRSGLFIRNSLKEFNAMYPNISCELIEGNIVDQTQQLLNGVTELGLLSMPVLQQDNFDILFERQEYIAAIFHKNSKWLENNSTTITIKELMSYPLSLSAGCHNLLNEYCEINNIKPRIVCTSTTRHTALRWAVENAAVAMVAIEPNETFDDNNLYSKQVTDLNTKIMKTIVKVKGRPLSATAKLFLKFYAKDHMNQAVCDLKTILKE